MHIPSMTVKYSYTGHPISMGGWFFEGFYLTRGYHSNNASATLDDVHSGRIAWFAHRTKHGKDSNWIGTSSGAE